MLLRDYLYSYDITVEQFADLVGISPGCLWHYFSGRRRPRRKMAERIIKLTHGKVTMEELRGKNG